jgi:hypothetical protein
MALFWLYVIEGEGDGRKVKNIPLTCDWEFWRVQIGEDLLFFVRVPNGPHQRRDSPMTRKPRIRRCHQPPLPFVPARTQGRMFSPNAESPAITVSYVLPARMFSFLLPG